MTHRRTRLRQLKTIAALYVDPEGPYRGMDNIDFWDEKRNAKEYAGPFAVVAHPPCGPWGRLKFLCKYQDPSCGLRAVEQVRRFGGVLEHPSGSTLWDACELPRPGKRDRFGFTVEVRQCDWGHPCIKPTMLYCVGVPEEVTLPTIRHGGKPTHRVTNGSGGDTTLPRATAAQIRQTPAAFADWLVTLARSVASVTSVT